MAGVTRAPGAIGGWLREHPAAVDALEIPDTGRGALPKSVRLGHGLLGMRDRPDDTRRPDPAQPSQPVRRREVA